MSRISEHAICANCTHWCGVEHDVGSCRYNPPVITEDSDGTWPATLAEEWCSRFSDAKEAPRTYDDWKRSEAGA